MTQAWQKKQLRLYLALAFGGAWTLQCAASWFAWQGNNTLFSRILAVSMFMPLAAVLLVRRGFDHMPTGVRWGVKLRGRVGWWLAALLGPAVFTLLGAALYYAVFPARLDLTGSYIQSVDPQSYETMLTQGVHPLTVLAGNLITCVTWAPFVNMLFAVGEEAGWRGYLYPALQARLGSGVKARVLGGVIWGAWHWPVMVLAGYEYGLHYWGAPVLGMALFCLVCVCLGTLLDVLYEKTGSIWAAALAHGGFNAVASTPLLLLNMNDPGEPTLGPMPIGLVALLPALAATVWVLARQAKREAAPPAQRPAD